ncbi:hypothetical protein CEP54_015371 [Fusarium duplospermum]|uniref:Uncharacterized protein n=1 Tax=Fusarium duplospermum TaxID=1325734 RepID=A0A428NPN9_9HYPO|nr:hypothetical protein CEP54_015371 [Fusarium duplospermum]
MEIPLPYRQQYNESYDESMTGCSRLVVSTPYFRHELINTLLLLITIYLAFDPFSTLSEAETLAGEKPGAARTLLRGRGTRLAPRSPCKLCTISTQWLCPVVSASETNRRGPVVTRAQPRLQKKEVVRAVHDCRGRSKQREAAQSRAQRPGRVRLTRPTVSRSRALRMLSGRPGLQKSVGRGVRGRARRPKGCRCSRSQKSWGSKESKAGQREGQKAMSRAREAQCRGEQAVRRKVNSLNPHFVLNAFLVAVAKPTAALGVDIGL